MKKYFVGLFIMASAICFTSCKNEAKDAPAKDGEKTEAKAEEQAQAAAEDEKVDLAALVENAKAEGANWTKDQWKTAIKDATKAMKPMLVEANELKKKMEAAKDDAETAKIVEELTGLMDKYKDVSAQMDEFTKLISANPIADQLIDDKAFEEEVKKELGLESLEF